MFFFPYKLDVSLYRIPFLTAFVCLLCFLTFSRQMSADSHYLRRISTHCAQAVDPNLQAILSSTSADGEHRGCVENLLLLRSADAREATIAEMARQRSDLSFYADPAKDIDYKSAKISSGFADFERAVPPLMTDKLAYDPSHYDVVRMLTSTFAHASWSHLIGNLIFFFIFASFVESAIGYVYYLLAFLLMAVTCSLAYSYSVGSAEGALPTVGLSGVVMGMLALITTLMPTARVRCLFWFLIFLRRFSLPLIVIALWYVGWDLYDHYASAGRSTINYVAHISGAATGAVLGLLFRLVHADRMRVLSAEMER
ncbi:membrane associated rhomboid family serine protease [Tahibacter aquaticus]|uniref:Membrane associated rhomboid family serine protease n=1 Tax=Tahibacter aquaticus TaxID=520092 RepID=A0A4R6Z0F8_9GAMM|nr:rhomboid family intramembrane serine protease [Tahibacter aquaticus]TDR45001.1 membrane associated rhomboid family serine protease [Tahibacter aquaticus]